MSIKSKFATVGELIKYLDASIAQQKKKQDKFSRLIDKGIAFYEGVGKKQDKLKALKFFKKAVKKEPSALIAWLYISKIYFEANPPYFGKALEALDSAFIYIGEAPKLREERNSVLIEWGTSLMQEKDYVGAHSCFQRVLQSDQQNREALSKSRVCALELGIEP